LARAPDEKIKRAKELYDQGKKLVDIATELEVPAGTVRRWKSTHKWDGERSGKKSERSVTKKISKNDIENYAAEEEINSVLENSELTEKQKLFCCYYIKSFNATKAYQKAYGCSYEIAAISGSRMLRNVKVKNEIDNLKQHRLNREMLTEDDIFQKYMDIAFADITDYASFGQEEVPVMGQFGPVQVKNPKTGKRETLMQKVSVVRLKESDEVDGTLISEVSQGRDGAKIKLADRMKALDWLSNHMNMATEEQRIRIAALKAKAQLDEEEELEDDGFLEALNGSAREDWEDEEED